jgi:regulatory protein
VPLGESAAELRARALRLLARREHSRAEIARKLALHAGSPEVLERVLLLLEQKNQLSDERYAEARAHQLARKYGAARIRQALLAKGIGKDTAERIATHVRKSELERANALLAKKYRCDAGDLNEYAKRARFLERCGFSHDVVRQALKIACNE